MRVVEEPFAERLLATVGQIRWCTVYATLAGFFEASGCAGEANSARIDWLDTDGICVKGPVVWRHSDLHFLHNLETGRSF